MDRIFAGIVALSFVVNKASGVITTDGFIDPAPDLVSVNNYGFGYQLHMNDDLLVTATGLLNTNEVGLISYEYNPATEEYDLNRNLINNPGTGNTRAVSISDSPHNIISTGGSASTKNNRFQLFRYGAGSWTNVFQNTAFPSKCYSFNTPYSSHLPGTSQHCQVVPISSNGAHMIAVPDNGFARVHHDAGGDAWAQEFSIDAGAFAYNNHDVNAAIFCGPNDEYVFFGGQFNPSEMFIAAHDHGTGSAWVDHQVLSLPVSPFTGTANAGIGWSLHCDPLNKTRVIVGNLIDKDVVDGTKEVGSAMILALDGTTWSVEATFRDSATETGFGSRVALYGRFAAVSEPEFSSNTGRVHYYYRNDVTEQWEKVDTVQQGTPVIGDYFGKSVAIFRDRLYVGALVNTVNGNTNAGRIHTVPLQRPTPAPTPSPTPPPFITVGTTKVQYNVKNATARGEIAQRAATDIRAAFARPNDLIVSYQSTETAAVPSQLLADAGNNETLLKELIADARGCAGSCTVNIDTGQLARRLEDTDAKLNNEITVEVVFELTESAYNDLVASGNNLDDPAFVNALATSLGVNASDVTITIVDGEIVVLVDLITEVTTEPSGSSTVVDLQNLQLSLNDATQVLVTELGGPESSVTTSSVDLCGARDCSGRGDASAPGTDQNGCNPNTGECECVGDFWGINCELACECNNGGECRNAYCSCKYPYFGLRCDEVQTNCTQCTV